MTIASKLAFTLGFVLLFNSTTWARGRYNDSVAKYYRATDQAEMFIIDSNYSDALKEYKIAFEFKSPNPSDLFNAFMVAYFKKDSSHAQKYFNALVLHGALKEYFDAHYKIKAIVNDQFYQWVTSGYANQHSIALKSEMRDYAKNIDSIMYLDQMVRKWRGKPSEEELGRMIFQDSINIGLMKTLIAKRGFPGYEAVGHFESWSSAGSGRINGSDPGIWLLMWHTRHLSKELNDLALDAVLNGSFPPDEYAIIMDTQQDEAVYYEMMPRDAENRLDFSLIKDSVAIDKKRGEIYLESLDHLRKKIAFSSSNNSFYLVPFWVMSLNQLNMDVKSWNKTN